MLSPLSCVGIVAIQLLQNCISSLYKTLAIEIEPSFSNETWPEFWDLKNKYVTGSIQLLELDTLIDNFEWRPLDTMKNPEVKELENRLKTKILTDQANNDTHSSWSSAKIIPERLNKNSVKIISVSEVDGKVKAKYRVKYEYKNLYYKSDQNLSDSTKSALKFAVANAVGVSEDDVNEI